MHNTGHNRNLYLSCELGSLMQASNSFYYVLLPFLVLGLDTNIHLVKLTVSAFFTGSALSFLVAGPFLDTFGERKISLTALFAFLLGTLICCFSSTVYLLICGRFIQGMSLGPLKVLSKSILASDTHGTKKFAIMSLALNLATPTSMLLTSLLLLIFSWRVSFGFFIAISLVLLYWVLRQRNMLRSNTVGSTKLRDHFKEYGTLLKNKLLLLLLISYASVYAIITPYYITITYLLNHTLHYKTHTLGIISIFITAFSMLGSYISLVISRTKFEKYIFSLGFFFVLLGCIMLYVFALYFPPLLFFLVLPILIHEFGVNFFYAKFNLLFLHSFTAQSQTVIISAMAVTRSLMNALVSAIAAFHGHKSITETASMMLVMAIFSIIVYWLPLQFLNQDNARNG